MPTWVSPTEATVHENQEMPTIISARPATNDDPFSVEIQEQETANEPLLKAIDEVYSPLLKLMKLFGVYFGDATLKRSTYISGHSGKHIFIHRIYCVLLVCCYWFNFIMAFTGIFFHDDIYLFLMFSFWCLFIALNGTVCLVVLPLTGRKTRFEKFLDSVPALVKNVDLEKVKEKSRKGLIMSCLLLIITPAIILVALILLKLNIGASEPWNCIWFGFSLLSPIFLMVGVGAWLLPILFFCITSLILEELFDDLLKRMCLLNSTLNDLDALKREYHKLCEVVELADKVLAPLLLVFISVYIPLLCFSFYNIVNLREHNSLLFLLGNLSWLLIVAVVLGLILFFGGKVNEKIHNFQKVLQMFPVSAAAEVKLLMFILDIQGDQKGLSIGGLVVVTKAMSITVVGVITSYFAVMLSLPG